MPCDATDATQKGWAYDESTGHVTKDSLCLSAQAWGIPLNLYSCGNATTHQNFTYDAKSKHYATVAPANSKTLYPADLEVGKLVCFVYTCRRLIDLSLLCIYMPAIDRPLSDCIYMPAIDRPLSLIAGDTASIELSLVMLLGHLKKLHEFKVALGDGVKSRKRAAATAMFSTAPAGGAKQPAGGTFNGHLFFSLY